MRALYSALLALAVGGAVGCSASDEFPKPGMTGFETTGTGGATGETGAGGSFTASQGGDSVVPRGGDSVVPQGGDSPVQQDGATAVDAGDSQVVEASSTAVDPVEFETSCADEVCTAEERCFEECLFGSCCGKNCGHQLLCPKGQVTFCDRQGGPIACAAP